MESTPVGTKIVKRIADCEGVDPVDLDVRLHEVIDADALEALASGAGGRRPQTTLRVAFSYCGYAVTVDGDGSVFIDEQPPETRTDELSGMGQ